MAVCSPSIMNSELISVSPTFFGKPFFFHRSLEFLPILPTDRVLTPPSLFFFSCKLSLIFPFPPPPSQFVQHPITTVLQIFPLRPALHCGVLLQPRASWFFRPSLLTPSPLPFLTPLSFLGHFFAGSRLGTRFIFFWINWSCLLAGLGCLEHNVRVLENLQFFCSLP